MTSPDLTSLWWFIAVVALIPLVLWLLKRTPLGGGGSGAGAPRTVGVLPLSASQKLVTIEVGQGEERLWLVLGVTPQSIRTLHTMSPQQQGQAGSTGAAPPPATAFAQLLSRMRQPGAGDDAR
jgi:flagellar protein FliO/FliZ